jgi:hypothetical protein
MAGASRGDATGGIQDVASDRIAGAGVGADDYRLHLRSERRELAGDPAASPQGHRDRRQDHDPFTAGGEVRVGGDRTPPSM